jgi:tetratricopeptide (TPR) repeat protein
LRPQRKGNFNHASYCKVIEHMRMTDIQIVHRASEMTKKGAAASNRKLRATGHSVEELVERGTTLIGSGQSDLAIPFLEKALRSEPGNTEALDLIGEAFVDIGEYQKAKAAFERSVTIAPEEAGTKWMFLGQMATGRQALDYYMRGCELLMKNEDSVARSRDLARANVAIAELFLTDLCMEEGAEHACEEAVAKAELFDPNSLEAAQAKASMRISQNRVEEARESLQKVAHSLLSTPWESRDVPFEFCVQTARLLVEVDDRLLGIQVLENLLKEDDENVEVWILLGHCHHHNDNDAALECFERAEELLTSFLETDLTDELFKAQLEHVRTYIAEIQNGEQEMRH